MVNASYSSPISENVRAVDRPIPSRLSKYIDVFLENARIAKEQDDERYLLYRGQSDFTYSLIPSVFREGRLPNEHRVIEDLLFSSPLEFSGINSSIERLIKMQHYGLPTRLLDVTLNPLVALYFACNEKSHADTDGEVVVFYDYMKRTTDQEAIIMGILAEYYGSEERQMMEFLGKHGLSNWLSINGLRTFLETASYIPILAPQNNERIKRQHGAFIIAGIFGGGGNAYQKAVFDLRPFLDKSSGDGILHRIVVPHQDKAELLEELKVLGINEAFLFPELEHQAMYIRSQYDAREP